jgi:hypothetical protein
MVAALRGNGEPDMANDPRAVGFEDFMRLAGLDAPAIVIAAGAIVTRLFQRPKILSARVGGQHSIAGLLRHGARGLCSSGNTSAGGRNPSEIAEKAAASRVYALDFVSVWHVCNLN